MAKYSALKLYELYQLHGETPQKFSGNPNIHPVLKLSLRLRELIERAQSIGGIHEGWPAAHNCIRRTVPVLTSS